MSLDTSKGVSVIVPLLNEAVVAEKLIAQLNELAAEQIIIVDGGSVDGTQQILQDAGYQVIDSSPGRAQQMNAGADQATEQMLLFLHADTELPRHYKSEVTKAHAWGRFDVSFFGDSSAMELIAFFINLRSRISNVATGDQAIFIDRDIFELIGGFPDLPIMEDVAISKRLRRLYKPRNSRLKVTTSARRWEQNGVLSTIIKMWWYRLAYFFGVPPNRLKRGYDDVR